MAASTMHGRRDNSETLDFAKRALDQIERLQLSAEPTYFEVWYHYFAGDKPALKSSLDELLARRGAISNYDLDYVSRCYLGKHDLVDRIAAAGRSFEDEVDQVLDMIEVALGVSYGLDAHLADAHDRITPAVDRAALRSIIEAVLLATKEMQDSNNSLNEGLEKTKENIAKLQEDLSLARVESLTDALTSLSNRRHFDQFLAAAWEYARRSNAPLSLILADIDHFKQFNDKHGHLIGDHVLRLIAAAIKESVKGMDFVCRFGGEEFAIVLPNTSLNEAKTVAQNIRMQLATKAIVKRSTNETLGQVTMSFGISAWRPDTSIENLIASADACLYAAKRAGRDCAICESELN